MRYLYNNVYANHWYNIAMMLDQNYPTENACVLLGIYSYTNEQNLRIQHNIGKNEKLIIYQTEPLVDSHWHTPEIIFNGLKQADEIWEYDINNYHYLRRHGFTNVSFKPFMYTKLLENIQEREPEIDVLFYGSMTQYRSDVLQKIDIFNKQMKFVFVYFITGNQLDDYISKSKIILDLNTWQKGYQKQSRISHLLNNKKCVLSEKSFLNFYKNGIMEFDIDIFDFQDKVSFLLQNDNWKKQGQFGYEIFKNMNIETFKDLYHGQI